MFNKKLSNYTSWDCTFWGRKIDNKINQKIGTVTVRFYTEPLLTDIPVEPVTVYN